jgi:hypothetical protein
VVLLAGELARSLGLPCPCLVEVRRLLLRIAKDGGLDADRPLAALVEVVSWVESMPARFVGRTGDDRDGPPHAGWLALITAGDALAIVAAPARDYLKRLGFDMPGCERSWERRGWLRCQGGRRTSTVRLPEGGRTRCWVFTSEARRMVEEGPPKPTDGQHNPWGVP